MIENISEGKGLSVCNFSENFRAKWLQLNSNRSYLLPDLMIVWNTLKFTYRWIGSTLARLYFSQVQKGNIRCSPEGFAIWSGRLLIWVRCNRPRFRLPQNRSTCTLDRFFRMVLQDFYACVVDSETAEATEGIEAGWEIVYVCVDGSALWFYSSEAEGVSLIKRIAIWGFHYNQFIIIVL